MTDQNFWIDRWKRQETGWHQKEVEPALIQNFAGQSGGRVLVPLCGKTLDMAWLADHGHEVIGVELSSQACDEFFLEQKLKPEVSSSKNFKVYRTPKLTIFQGDFFDFTSEQAGDLTAIYDRAALIALPPYTQKLYAVHLKQLSLGSRLKSNFHILQIAIEKTDEDDGEGPPFSVSFEELKRLYGDHFEISLLSHSAVVLGGKLPKNAEESVYRLIPR